LKKKGILQKVELAGGKIILKKTCFGSDWIRWNI